VQHQFCIDIYMLICHIIEMERTTIYLNEEIKDHIIDLTAKMSKERRKRVTMTDIIHDALKEYLRRKGIEVGNKEEVIKEMLSTKGSLDNDEFESRVLEVKEAFSGWKIRSV